MPYALNNSGGNIFKSPGLYEPAVFDAGGAGAFKSTDSPPLGLSTYGVYAGAFGAKMLFLINCLVISGF